jgi:hypothetical protein
LATYAADALTIAYRMAHPDENGISWPYHRAPQAP